MKGKLTKDITIPAPAAAVWESYRSHELGRLVNLLLVDVIGRVEVVEGDGGVGSIVKLIFPPGTPGIGYLKEVFVEMDDQKRVKESKVLEGGFIHMGFDGFGFRLEIIENDAESSIVRSSVLYEIDDRKAELVSLVSTEPLEIIGEAVGKYLVQKHKSTTASN